MNKHPISILKFIVEQVTDPKNSYHTLGAYSHGVGIQMAREAIENLIPHPLESAPEKITIGANDAGEAINIAIIAIQMGIPVAVHPEPPFATFTHLVHVFATPDQVEKFNQSLERIK